MNLLDLDPQSFEVYLAESNPPPEQRKFLVDEYQKRRSLFAPGFEAIQQAEQELADEGRRRLNILPASVPQGMSFYDALAAGKADFAVPGMFTGIGESLMTAVDMPVATLTGPTSFETMEESAQTLSELLAMGAAPAILRAASRGVDPSTARMFVGSGTKNPNAKKALDRATELYAKGEGPEDIWRITSEEFPNTPASVLPDGTPFYEISDENALTRNLIDTEVPDPERAEYFRQQILPSADGDRQLLSEVLLADELYADVPGITSLETQLQSLGGDVPRGGGLFYRGTDGLNPRIKVSPDLSYNPKAQAAVLLHEVEHGVQAETGLPGGTNISEMDDAIRDALAPERQTQMELNSLADSISSIQRGFDAPEELVLPFLQRLDKNALQVADTNRKNHLKVINAAKQPNTGQYGGARGLYMRNQGEALARLTAARRKLTMEERRAKPPMRQLERGLSDLLAWENLADVRSGQDVRQLFEFETPSVEGISAPAYSEAVDIFVRNQLRDLVEDTTKELKGATSPEQRSKTIEAGQKRIDKVFNKALSSYKK